MKKDRKWLYLIIIILVALLVSWSGYNWLNRDVVATKAVTIVRGPIAAVISASGTVDAPIYDLGTKMGGRLENWKVREGEKVRKGQLMAEFDSYEQARNDYERAAQLYKEGAASQQALDASKTMFDSARIIAPADGIVAKINFDEGETVVPGQPAVTVVNYDKSWVNAQIDEIDIASVKIGDKVTVTSDVYPDKNFLGEIFWIAPLAELRQVGGRVKMDEESYVFPCKIRFLGTHDELKANMSVNVDIVTKQVANALLVPRESLVSKGEAQTVFVIKGGRSLQIPLTIGIRSFASVEALSGVQAGDLVAVANGSKLKDKGRVKIER
ncbi:MAG: efflux RND transporter periplasmic adaptor subunit [Candidatus Margulisiibacteriota bacterium]